MPLMLYTDRFIFNTFFRSQEQCLLFLNRFWRFLCWMLIPGSGFFMFISGKWFFFVYGTWLQKFLPLPLLFTRRYKYLRNIGVSQFICCWCTVIAATSLFGVKNYGNLSFRQYSLVFVVFVYAFILFVHSLYQFWQSFITFCCCFWFFLFTFYRGKSLLQRLNRVRVSANDSSLHLFYGITHLCPWLRSLW